MSVALERQGFIGETLIAVKLYQGMAPRLAVQRASVARFAACAFTGGCMDKIKKHAIWVILIAIIVGVVLMFKARKVAADDEVQHIPASVSSCAKYTHGMLDPSSLAHHERRRSNAVK
jgi:hypothetical protein